MYATPGYSTDDFLNAHTCFTSNHRTPSMVVTDSGSQLVKAGKLLDQTDRFTFDWECVKEGTAKNGTEWKVA